MVALDDVVRAKIENAHIARLEELVENVRFTLAGPSSPKEKVAWLTELLNVQGYRIDAPQ